MIRDGEIVVQQEAWNKALRDAERYRYLKDNRRLLNITIEAYNPTRKTVQGKDADACVDWHMQNYPLQSQSAAEHDGKSFDGTVKRIEADYEAATGKDKK